MFHLARDKKVYLGEKNRKKSEPFQLTNSEYEMLMLTFFCDMISNSDTWPPDTSSNHGYREAMFCIFGEQ